MLKNISKLEYKIGERLYQLILDNDSPIDHVKEALFQFQKYIGQIEDQVKAQQLAQQSEQKNDSMSKVKEDSLPPEVVD